MGISPAAKSQTRVIEQMFVEASSHYEANFWLAIEPNYRSSGPRGISLDGPTKIVLDFEPKALRCPDRHITNHAFHSWAVWKVDLDDAAPLAADRNSGSESFFRPRKFARLVTESEFG